MWWRFVWLWLLPLAALPAMTAAERPAGQTNQRDADLTALAQKSLTSRPGDATKGRAIVRNRQLGLCLLCHSGPFPEEPLQGTLAPSLAGAGARWSESDLRLRIIDARLANPATIMPPYFSVEGLQRVAPAFVGKTLLTAEQIEDVVAYLTTLKE